MAIKSKALRVVIIILASITALIVVLAATALIANSIHRDNMEEYIDSFDKVEYENQLKPSVDERGNYFFTKDDDFKVMQLTDIHLGGGFLFADGDKKALHAVASMVAKEKPDLVVVTGDISFAVPWSGTLDNSIAHGYFKRLMENLGVYWTVTLGNHDSEKYNYHNREAVGKMYMDDSLEYCLFSAGPEDVFGECNHVITVQNSLGLITSSFVMIDSNAYTDKDIFGLGWDYDNVHDDQIAWYRENIEYYTAKNLEVYNALNESERPSGFNTDAVRSFIYMHIPPEEMLKSYDEAAHRNELANTEKYGIAGESGRVVYSSEYPDNLFETVVELGSTEGIFFGHDHLNSLRFIRAGVLMAYGYSIDYSAYAGSTGYQRGCTVITLKSDDWSYKYSNYYSGAYDNLSDDVDMTLPEVYR